MMITTDSLDSSDRRDSGQSTMVFNYNCSLVTFPKGSLGLRSLLDVSSSYFQLCRARCTVSDVMRHRPVTHTQPYSHNSVESEMFGRNTTFQMHGSRSGQRNTKSPNHSMANQARTRAWCCDGVTPHIEPSHHDARLISTSHSGNMRLPREMNM